MPVGKTYPLSLVLTAVDKVTAVMNKIDKSVDGVGKKFGAAGRKLTTGLTLPIVGIGAAATKGFADFEKRMASVGTLIDTNTEDLGAMGDEVLRLGNELPVATNDLADALYQVRSAGVAASDQFDVLENSARLAVAGLGTTEQAVDIVTSAVTSFGLEGDDAAGVYDTLFTTIAKGKTDLSQLSQGFGDVAGVIAKSGTEFDEYMAAVAALTSGGVKASTAQRQLRQVLAGLNRTTALSKKTFRALGVKTFPELIQKTGGLVPAMQAVNKQLDGNTSKLQTLLGSQEALNAVQSLSGGLAENYADAMAAMADKAGAVTTGFDTQNKTLTASWQRTKNTLLSAGMVIGETVAPLIEKLSQGVRAAAEWWRGLDESTQGWILRAGAAVAAIGPLISIVGKGITGVQLLARGVVFASNAFKALKVVLATNPIGFALTAIATAALLIYDNWEDLAPFFRRIWDDLKIIFDAAWEWMEPVVGRMVDGVKAIKEAGEFIANLIVDDDIGTISLEEGRRRAGIAPPPPVPVGRSRSSVDVNFQNAPAGMRVEPDPTSDDEVGVSVGYQMGVAP